MPYVIERSWLCTRIFANSTPYLKLVKSIQGLSVRKKPSAYICLSLLGRLPHYQRDAGGQSHQGSPAGWSDVSIRAPNGGQAVAPCSLDALANEADASGGVGRPTGGGCPLVADEAGSGAGRTPRVCFIQFFFTSVGNIYHLRDDFLYIFFSHEVFLFQKEKNGKERVFTLL